MDVSTSGMYCFFESHKTYHMEIGTDAVLGEGSDKHSEMDEVRQFAFRNNLESLPPEIGELQNLERLVLSNNKLTSLPPEIGKLKKLDVKFEFDQGQRLASRLELIESGVGHHGGPFRGSKSKGLFGKSFL